VRRWQRSILHVRGDHCVGDCRYYCELFESYFAGLRAYIKLTIHPNHNSLYALSNSFHAHLNPLSSKCWVGYRGVMFKLSYKHSYISKIAQTEQLTVCSVGTSVRPSVCLPVCFSFKHNSKAVCIIDYIILIRSIPYNNCSFPNS